MVEPRALVTVLNRAGHRVTAPRRALIELISARDGAFSAADLEEDLRRRRLRIGRATIFRTLDLFSEASVVERLDLPSGQHAYVRCEPAHHHHVVCSRCGRTTEVADCGMASVSNEAARRTGYRIERHRLELFGLCPACQARPRDEPRADAP